MSSAFIVAVGFGIALIVLVPTTVTIVMVLITLGLLGTLEILTNKRE